jgi:peptidoglycan/xylan/chitin deacetylase (PgdA/CDA1 family)
MRNVTSGKRANLVSAAAGFVLALATAAGAAPPSRDGPAVLQRLVWRAQPVYCGGPRGRLVALTFDDGPGPYSMQVLNALRRGHARATFFLVGSRVAYWPQAARAEAGVDVLGNHTWSHPHLPKLPPARDREELVRAQRAIVAETNVVPAVFRPPYEESTPRIDRMASGLGLLDVRWSVDSGDALPGATPARVAAAVAAGVRPGSIVLLHDAHPWTARAVGLVLAELRARRLRPVTVTDLLELDPPTAAQLAPHANGRCG